MPRREVSPLISTGLQPGVEATEEGPAVLTASRVGVETAEAVRVSAAIPNTWLKPGANERCSDFLLWQLADSAFPTGGFAHSAGLEAAWQHGEVRNRGELLSYVEASLQQLGRAALPFVSTAHDEPQRLEELDRLCDAFTSNHVANRASRAQGRAFLSAVERIFKVGQASSLSGEPMSASKVAPSAPAGTGRMPVLPCAHLAPVFGASLRWLDVPRDTALRLFVFNHLRSLIAAAVRLNIVGPMEAQSLQQHLSSPTEALLQRSVHLTLDDLATSAVLT